MFITKSLLAGSIAISALAASVGQAQSSTYPFVAGQSADTGERVMAFASRIDTRLRDSTDSLQRMSLPRVASVDLFGNEFVVTAVSARSGDGASRDVGHVWLKQGGRWRVIASNESALPARASQEATTSPHATGG
jgi:hypothetical protein